MCRYLVEFNWDATFEMEEEIEAEDEDAARDVVREMVDAADWHILDCITFQSIPHITSIKLLEGPHPVEDGYYQKVTPMPGQLALPGIESIS